MWRICLICLFAAFCDRLSSQAVVEPVALHPAREHPIVEDSGTSRSLNFDLVVSSKAEMPLRISEVQMSVYDAEGHLALRKALNTDAFAPSIEVIGERMLLPGHSLDIFNPFSEFDPRIPLDDLRFSICLLKESNAAEAEKNHHRLPGDCDLRAETAVRPRTYETKTALVLPLKGTVFIWEGHDYLAHHFRVPLGNPKIQQMGISANSNEFASDFIYVDGNGRSYHDNPRKLENWYSYGQPIYAPGAGVVAAMADDIPDNSISSIDATSISSPQLPAGKDPKDVGNFVLINHEDGEYSLLIHMKPGSVRVKAGDRVSQGQEIGNIGFSGDSIFPHLHYALMDGAEVFKAWGLPAYFKNFRRRMGTVVVEVPRGPVNSGMFVESEFHYPEGKRD